MRMPGRSTDRFFELGAHLRRAKTVGWALLFVLLVGAPGGSAWAQDAPIYTNLHVLPQDISRAELSRTMLANLSGLGLRRRANEGCLFCHVGSMEVPASEWDWASDENPMKPKARTMMAMVADINETYLARIDRTSSVDVGCYTCHAGRTNPMSLPEVLEKQYQEGGIQALIDSYRTLRTRYFASDAYDFRVGVLSSVAQTIAEAGQIGDAARVHELNIEHSDDASAHRGLIQLRMVEALGTDGIAAMVARYHSLKQDHPPEAYSPMLIDPLAWYLFRGGQQEAGYRLFSLNFEEHPGAYLTTEDLAWGNEMTGRHDRAIALAEAWLATHPDHELGLRLLSDLRREGGH